MTGILLAPGSVVSSDGIVAITGCAEQGNFQSAGGTYAESSTFTGAVELGTSLEVHGIVTFDSAGDGTGPLSVGNLTIDNGYTLTGTDSFDVDGMLTLSAHSHLSVSGSVNAYGGLELEPYAEIKSTTLNNYGAATWDLGPPTADVQLDAAAVINNLAGATFTTVGAGSASINDGGSTAFNNAGTFTTSAADGVAISAPFVNTGSVIVEQGSLSVPSFTNAGGGTVTVAPGASFNGSGSLQSPVIVSSGDTLTTTPGETITTSLILAGGTLDITGSLTIDGTLALEDGSTLTGGGSVDAVGGISFAGNVAISAINLNNHGAAVWDHNTSGPNNNITLLAGAVINNLAGATFNAVGGLGSGGAIIAGDGSTVAFNNDGTFISNTSGGAGTNIEVPFNQTGTGATTIEGGGLSLSGMSTIDGSLTAAAGTVVAMTGGGTVTGSVIGATGSTIEFIGSSTSLDATSSVTCAGTVIFEGTVTVAGQFDVTASTQILNGTVSFTDPIVDLGADLEILRDARHRGSTVSPFFLRRDLCWKPERTWVRQRDGHRFHELGRGHDIGSPDIDDCKRSRSEHGGRPGLNRDAERRDIGQLGRSHIDECLLH